MSCLLYILLTIFLQLQKKKKKEKEIFGNETALELCSS